MHDSPFATRGLIEGFYGTYYSVPERNELIRFLGRQGYNLYIYAPKNDRQHRTRWWEPYPLQVMARFAQTLAVARRAGVTFCYALAPISYEGEADFARVVAKLQAFFAVGVRAFSILVDDLAPPIDPEQKPDANTGYAAFAEAHIALCNRVYAWLVERDAACTLSVCPTDYHGRPPFSQYLRALGERLHPAIEIFYTGREVCSPTISRADAEAFAEAVGRPPLIWDNYPVNDLSMRQELHLGPIRGRDPALAKAVRGIVVNPMLQPEASKIALLTYAEYLRDPQSYEPDAAWERALRQLGGAAGYRPLREFAENALDSCLGTPAPSRLAWLARATLADLQRGHTLAESPPARSLAEHLDALDESCYALKNRVASPALRRDLLPWIEALEDWLWLGRRALRVLSEAAGDGLSGQTRGQFEESLASIRSHNRTIGGEALLPLVEHALASAELRSKG
jgi:hyaluronoglucosaminidase